jgi:hypothetical protein
MIIFGIGKAAYDGNIMPVLCESVPPALMATGFGVLNFAGTLAGGAMTVLAGALKSAVGLNDIFVTCGVLLTVSGLFALRISVSGATAHHDLAADPQSPTDSNGSMGSN